MALIFHDTLQARDSTGLYTLMANINGEWTDIHTVAGAQNGTIEIDAGINTIAVDTDMLPVGQTFQFKWVDSLGNESNIVSALVPFTILDYYTSNEDITCVNNGGDSWTFTVPYTPPPNDPSDLLINQIDFYTDSGMTTLVGENVSTSTQTFSFSGLGAGTYALQTFYVNGSGAHLVLAAALFMVDASGNILRELVISGFTDVSYSGMDISCTADYQATNAAIELGAFITFDSTFNNQTFLAVGSNTLTDQQLPVYPAPSMILAYGLQLDQSEWTAGVAAPGAPTGCGMTVMTNLP